MTSPRLMYGKRNADFQQLLMLVLIEVEWIGKVEFYSGDFARS
jgi:hypothetical protein